MKRSSFRRGAPAAIATTAGWRQYLLDGLCGGALPMAASLGAACRRYAQINPDNPFGAGDSPRPVICRQRTESPAGIELQPVARAQPRRIQ